MSSEYLNTVMCAEGMQSEKTAEECETMQECLTDGIEKLGQGKMGRAA